VADPAGVAVQRGQTRRRRRVDPAVQTPSAPPALLTAEEFARRHDGDYVELIDGMVVPIMPGGARHGKVCIRLVRIVGGFIEDRGLGLVCSHDTFVLTQRNPDRVRGADLVYWSKERWSGEVPDGIVDAAPDLVAEVRSPADRWGDVQIKTGEYLNAGVRVVVLLDPKTATVYVHRQDELQQLLHNGDEPTLPDVLPGFAVPITRFFE
jgi:Uma2 family endonuclease